MGRAHILINQEILDDLYDRGPLLDLIVVSETRFDDSAGIKLVQISSSKLPPDYTGMREIVAEHGSYRLKAYEPGYET